jgi:hypothetical protein
MAISPQVEALCERAQLVAGLGDPQEGRFCVMSLVAYLASEPASDAPRSASPVIRAFVIPVNDGMPCATRQRLKPFAPRIIGTRDGHDDTRATLLCRADMEELLPQLARRREATPSTARARTLRQAWNRLFESGSVRRLTRLVHQVEHGGQGRPIVPLASATGQLISLVARNAAASDQAWYWNHAVGLLDRMCEAGAEARASERREACLLRSFPGPRQPGGGAGSASAHPGDPCGAGDPALAEAAAGSCSSGRVFI